MTTEKNNKEYQTVILAALLHDIGKFVQRASKNPKAKKHQEFGFEWLKNHFSKEVCELAKRHHWVRKNDLKYNDLSPTKASNKNLAIIIAEADNLSAGERPEKQIEEEWIESESITSQNNQSKITFLSRFELDTPLVSVFSKLTLTKKNRAYNDCWRAYPLKEMSNTCIYPEPPPKTVEEGRLWKKILKKHYENQWNEFFNEFTSKVKGTPYIIENVLLLLEKYTSFIPSETMIITKLGKEIPEPHPDVSLFDHLKTTAAIASCLYLHFTEKDNKGIQNPTKKRYLLVGGDLTGIQKFIYTISSKGALKTLRARSFLIELLTEKIVYEILDNLGMYRTNLIYSGGGKFYLLLPNTPRVVEKLGIIKSKINEYLLTEYNARLSLVLEFVEFCGNAFITARERKMKCSNREDAPICERCSVAEDGRPTITISDVWEVLEDKLYNGKRHKFKEELKILYQKDPLEPEKGTCKVCRKDVEEEGLTPLIKDEEDKVEACQLCKYLFELGGNLPKKKYFPLDEIKVTKDSSNSNTILVFNDWDLNSYKDKKSYPLFIGNYPPDDINVPREFTELADKSMGVKRLGALRMDIDNLGEMIFRGFKDKDKTFSRLSAFSRQLSYFFKLYINEICKGNTPENRVNLMKRPQEYRNAVIIYSGGDDLFIVGAWDEIVEISFDIRSAFKKYTCYNPDINISGGLVVLPPKFPLYQTAELTKKAEEEAKSNEDEFGRKDSISFFYTPALASTRKDELPISLKWDLAKGEKILLRVKEFIDNFGIIEEDYLKLKIPRSFLYNLFRIIEIKRLEGKLYLPMLAYTLSMTEDNLFRTLRKGEWEEAWMNLKNDLMHIDGIDNLYTILIWIELLSRKEGDECE
jgi:CRISPR-associated protein Csm1